MKFLKNLILLSVIILPYTVTSFAKGYLKCPPASTIKIIPGSGSGIDSLYDWIAPDITFADPGTAPQNGSKALGEVIAVQAHYTSQVRMYDLLCIYPTDATTTRVPLPPKAGYILYRINGVAKGYCHESGMGFLCGK